MYVTKISDLKMSYRTLLVKEIHILILIFFKLVVEVIGCRTSDEILYEVMKIMDEQGILK